MASPDFLVKLRDALQMAADACQERLEQMAPKEEKKHNWNPEAVNWVEAEGSKGSYQKATAQETSTSPDFTALVEDLKKHKGKLSRAGWFYWLFTSMPTTVGRKRQRS